MNLNAGTVKVGSDVPNSPRPTLPLATGTRTGNDMGIVTDERRITEAARTKICKRRR